MSAITTRVTAGSGATVKNAPLTNAEIDTNFININVDKLETSEVTSLNTAGKVVKRDSLGNFSAGTITAALSGNATSATNVSGGAAGSIPYNTAAGATAFLALGAANYVLIAGPSSAPQYTSQSSLSVGTAASLLNARTISIGTGATGTATSFNGSADITIPITAVNADYVSSGTLASARLGTTGTPQFSSIGVGVAASGTAGRIDATSIYVTSLVGSGSSQISSLGVGTGASGTAGEIRATNSITSWYSDERLKENIIPIQNALSKVNQLVGVTFNANELAKSFGFSTDEQQVGVLAGDVLKVQPEAVKPAPFDRAMSKDGIEISKSGQEYKTVQYEKLVPLLIEAIKELSQEIEVLKGNK